MEFKKAKEELQKQIQKRREEKAGEGTPSFFSKALKWTRELAADITEELEKARKEVECA